MDGRRKRRVAVAVVTSLILLTVAGGLVLAPSVGPGQRLPPGNDIPDPIGPGRGAYIVYGTTDGSIINFASYDLKWSKDGCQQFRNTTGYGLPAGEACVDVTLDPNWRIAWSNVDVWALDLQTRTLKLK